MRAVENANVPQDSRPQSGLLRIERDCKRTRDEHREEPDNEPWQSLIQTIRRLHLDWNSRTLLSHGRAFAVFRNVAGSDAQSSSARIVPLMPISNGTGPPQ